MLKRNLRVQVMFISTERVVQPWKPSQQTSNWLSLISAMVALANLSQRMHWPSEKMLCLWGLFVDGCVCLLPPGLCPPPHWPSWPVSIRRYTNEWVAQWLNTRKCLGVNCSTLLGFQDVFVRTAASSQAAHSGNLMSAMFHFMQQEKQERGRMCSNPLETVPQSSMCGAVRSNLCQHRHHCWVGRLQQIMVGPVLWLLH